MKIHLLALIFTLSGFTPQVPEYKIGEKVNNFSLINTINNKQINLFDFSDKKAVVLIFTSHSCPYSKIYDNRLVSLAKEFEASGIKFLFINSQNNGEEDSQLNMSKWASQHNVDFLIDPKKEIANQFAATKTPEVFLLKNMNGNFILQYKGAIDDNPQAAHAVQVHYLKDALNAVITGNPIKVIEKRPVGCVLK